jgi:hypothetical protein
MLVPHKHATVLKELPSVLEQEEMTDGEHWLYML